MSNVLGTLFGQIADAIRGKTGDTVTMKPAEFPDKIAAIETGGGGGGNSYTIKSGSFTASNNIDTIEHGCGEVPDIVFVYADHTPVDKRIYFATGYSQAMHDALGGGYIAPICFLVNGGSMSYSLNHGIEGTSNSAQTYGCIRDATSTTFKIGGTLAMLESGKGYSFVCICGIV
ncbi:MAG: hypothetical protein IKC97_09500 [Clostridia bacterium]|nr:hypothetical protein [Clostridia bacterium]